MINMYGIIWYVNMHTDGYRAAVFLSFPPFSANAWQIFLEFSHYTVGKSCRAARSGHCLWWKESAHYLTDII